jgi:hypothetical protein
MSKIQNPIIGRAKGQAGGMVFSTLYGANVMRAKPFQYRDKNSTSQQKFRSLFRYAVDFAAKLKFYAAYFFETPPAKMSPYSKLISQIRPAFTLSGQAVAFDPDTMQIGQGSIPTPDTLTLTNTGVTGSKFEFASDELQETEDLTDSIAILAVSLDGTQVALCPCTETRADEKATIVLPADLIDYGQNVYVSDPIFRSADGQLSSPVRFNGKILANS